MTKLFNNVPDKFEIEQKKLLEIIDVALFTFNKCNDLYESVDLNNRLAVYSKFRIRAKSPKQRRVSNLNAIKQDVLVYFQEVHGQDVNFFWREIEAREIDLKRVNKLEIILKKKRISNDAEYDYITDMLVEAQQIGEITAETAELLDHYLEVFEKKHMS